MLNQCRCFAPVAGHKMNRHELHDIGCNQAKKNRFREHEQTEFLFCGACFVPSVEKERVAVLPVPVGLLNRARDLKRTTRGLHRYSMELSGDINWRVHLVVLHVVRSPPHR